MKHKHAELMAQYAQDAAETDKPWERWERYHDFAGKWVSLTGNPSWYNAAQYRRKPKVILINGFEVPEPVREPLKHETVYFTPSITRVNGADCHTWDGGKYDNSWLSRGLIHLTKEAATLHAEALLSFTKK